MSLIKADMDIASLYVDLVPDKEMGRHFFGLILDEYSRTHDAVLSISGHAQLLEAEPVTQNAVLVRNPYVDPLNHLQVDLLRQYRGGEGAAEDREQILHALLLSVNGIAAGMRNTG